MTTRAASPHSRAIAFASSSSRSPQRFAACGATLARASTCVASAAVIRFKLEGRATSRRSMTAAGTVIVGSKPCSCGMARSLRETSDGDGWDSGDAAAEMRVHGRGITPRFARLHNGAGRTAAAVRQESSAGELGRLLCRVFRRARMTPVGARRGHSHGPRSLVVVAKRRAAARNAALAGRHQPRDFPQHPCEIAIHFGLLFTPMFQRDPVPCQRRGAEYRVGQIGHESRDSVRLADFALDLQRFGICPKSVQAAF